MTARLFAASVLAAALLLGCKDETKTTTDRPSAPAAPSTPPPGGPAEGPGSTNLPGMTQLKDAGTQMQNQATTQMQGAQQQGAAAISNLQGQAGELIKQAQTKIEEVKKAIAGGKWTDADTLLKGVETMKTQLPKEYQDQIDGLRKTINEAMARLKAPAAPQ